RDVVLVAKLRSIVDDDAAGLRSAGRMHFRDACAGREQPDLGLREVERLEILNGNILAFELDRAPDGTRARERIELADRKIPLLEDGKHRAPDQAGRAHHRHIPTSAHRRLRSIEANPRTFDLNARSPSGAGNLICSSIPHFGSTEVKLLSSQERGLLRSSSPLSRERVPPKPRPSAPARGSE